MFIIKLIAIDKYSHVFVFALTNKLTFHIQNGIIMLNEYLPLAMCYVRYFLMNYLSDS